VIGLAKTLAAMTLLMPVGVQALGIGDIRLHSSLDQNLHAEIVLTLAPGENPADIHVRLAPPEKFDRAGVPWTYFLSKLHFETVTRTDGSMVVKVTSREALTEPFLNFLLEVTWPQGAQTREFTLLVDPPVIHPSAQTLPPVAGIPTAAATLSNDDDRPARRPYTPRRRAAPEAKDTQPRITADTPAAGEYGPTRAAETLWSIAERLGAEHNVPTRQMMYALFQANPDAFNRGDMDSMKIGVVLRIPETDALQAATTPSAKKAKLATRQPTFAAEQKNAGKSLELVAPSEAKIPETSSDAKPTTDSTGAEGGVVASAGASPSGQDLALQARIEKLEQQLGMMQQLLALKDQQLATLQNKDQKPQEAAPQTAPTVDQPPVTEVASVPTEKPAAIQPAEAPAAPPVIAEPAPPVVAPEPATPAPPKPAVVVAPEEDSLLESPVYLFAAGGIGATLLGGLGWLWWRKRKIETQTNTDSMFASASQIKIPEADSGLSVPVLDMGASSSYDVGTVGESSFISDFTPSDFDAFDTDQNEIDPLSEADVYLAYGRYQQAEDLIRKAIKEQPHKNEYKLKLLEIFYANENRDAFSIYAHDLAREGKQSDAVFWAKVSEMAREIIPDSALFGGSGAANIRSLAADNKPAPPAKANFDIAADDDLADLDSMIEFDADLAELKLDGSHQQTNDNGLDFDLSAFDFVESAAAPDKAKAATDIESIDFDLSTLSLESSKPASPQTEPQKTSANETIDDFDFNFDLPEAKPHGQAAASHNPGIESLEHFDFPDFATLAKEIEAQPSPSASKTGAIVADNDDFNFDFNFETPDSRPKTGNDDVLDFGVSDLTDMDEFETKIDLAKAYIDMGDTETARKIAEEIVEKGNNEQKQAAQLLIDDIG